MFQPQIRERGGGGGGGQGEQLPPGCSVKADISCASTQYKSEVRIRRYQCVVQQFQHHLPSRLPVSWAAAARVSGEDGVVRELRQVSVAETKLLPASLVVLIHL